MRGGFPFYSHQPAFQNPPGTHAMTLETAASPAHHPTTAGVRLPLAGAGWRPARRRHITMKHRRAHHCGAGGILTWPRVCARLLLWRPSVQTLQGPVRHRHRYAGLQNMSSSRDGVRIIGRQLWRRGRDRWTWARGSAPSPGVTVDARGGLIRIGKQVAITGPGTVLRAANHCFDSLESLSLQGRPG